MIQKQRIKRDQSWFLECQICNKTQQQLLADILVDDSKCKITICTICLNQKNSQNSSCSVCGLKFKDHKKKLKNISIKQCIQKGRMQYQKMFSMRTQCKKLENIDEEMVSLLTTLFKFDKEKYKARFKDLKKLDEQIEKQKNYVLGDGSKQNKASNLPKFTGTQDNGDGKQGCGWNQAYQGYEKGIKLIFDAFSFNKDVDKQGEIHANRPLEQEQMIPFFSFTQQS